MKLLNTNLPPNTVQAAKLSAVILDWAGTIVDHGSLAPVRTLQRVFEEAGYPLHEEDARQDMGLPKRDHIRRILHLPRVAAAWRAETGRAVTESDVDALYQRFIPLQFECLEAYSHLIPGVLEAAGRIRARGLKIATTTGYTRGMLDVLVAKAAREGFSATANLTPEDVGSGRPNPFMIFQHAVTLQVFPLAAIVKVGDTVADIQEGLNAGAWSVGVTTTGNMVGLSQEEFAALPPALREEKTAAARAALTAAGAHFVVDGVAQIDCVLDAIDGLLRDGRQA